jgi:hypothetical protein
MQVKTWNNMLTSRFIVHKHTFLSSKENVFKFVDETRLIRQGNAAIVAPSALYGIAGMPLGCYRKSKRK